MTKEDFYILRNSITMLQIVDHYGFKITRKGKNNFIRCPFHGGGSERTPSMIIYEGYRGFYCRGCGQGGDVTRFVELYEGVTTKEAALILSERFGVPISDNSEIPEATRQKAQQAEFDRQQQLIHQRQIQAKLNHISDKIHLYERAAEMIEPFSSELNFIYTELAKMKDNWEWLFAQLKN